MHARAKLCENSASIRAPPRAMSARIRSQPSRAPARDGRKTLGTTSRPRPRTWRQNSPVPSRARARMTLQNSNAKAEGTVNIRRVRSGVTTATAVTTFPIWVLAAPFLFISLSPPYNRRVAGCGGYIVVLFVLSLPLRWLRGGCLVVSLGITAPHSPPPTPWWACPVTASRSAPCRTFSTRRRSAFDRPS